MLDSRDCFSRAEHVRVERAKQWVNGLSEDAECFHDGERCALCLFCNHNSTAGVNYCMPLKKIEKSDKNERIVLPKKGSRCHNSCSAGLRCMRVEKATGRFCAKARLSDKLLKPAALYKAFEKGAECVHVGEQCGLGLVCKHNSRSGVCLSKKVKSWRKKMTKWCFPKKGHVAVILACSVFDAYRIRKLT